MCRRVKICSELGADPSAWSPTSPLWPKDWFPESLAAFKIALEAARTGDGGSALNWLSSTREPELNEWFDVHAQNSGRFRAMHYRVEPEPAGEWRDSTSQVTRFERDLFDRDGHRCRYCGTEVIPGRLFKEFQSLVGSENFRTAGTNKQRHGVKLVFSGTLDHVEPFSRGGRTAPGNLVTCCWPCNYGKADYTLSQLGLHDPR